MVHTKRQELLFCLGRLTHGETAKKARQAHAGFRIREPTIEEIARYAKCNDVDRAVASRCTETLLSSLRTKPLKRGIQKQEVAGFQKAVFSVLESSVRPEAGRVANKFRGVALSISRLIAFYYVDADDKRSLTIDERLKAVLPYLAEHLLAETELCLGAKFTSPQINLSKVSVFDIQEKLEMLQAHQDEVVRRNARNILSAALRNGNLALADTLAAGAKEKLSMLENHHDEVVRDKAKTIIYAVLNRANLALADKLAAGAKLKKQQKRDEVVTTWRGRASVLC
jgi:hypothetical protein